MKVIKDGQEYLVPASTTPSQLAPRAPANAIVNGRPAEGAALNRPLRDGDMLEWAPDNIVKAMLTPREQDLVVRDLAMASAYFEQLCGTEFEVDFEYRQDYCVITNFPLPRGFLQPNIPLLVPLSGFPLKPPPGLHVPTSAPDTPRLAKSYYVNGTSPPPYSRTHDLTANGWAWLCLRKKTEKGDGWDWDYEHTTGGLDSIKKLLVVFDSQNRVAVGA